MNTLLAGLRQSGRLRRVDVKLGEWVAHAFPQASPEVILVAALTARAIADGHSALALDQAQAWLAGLAEGKALTLPEASAWREALRHSRAVHTHADGVPIASTPLVLDAQGRIYLRRYFEYERQLAQALMSRTRGDTAHPTPPPQAGEGDERVARVGEGNPVSETNRPVSDLDPEQQRAIDTALSRRFTLVTGGPGTGKTHSVMRMLAALAQRAHGQGETLRIVLAAPTGKAAARLSESLGAQIAKSALPAAVATQIPPDAKTVHNLLGMSPWRVRPRFDRATPLSYDVVVVDEVSMVDLSLMVKLVNAVPDAARLILLGDPGQLAAVEAGNVLGALVEAAAEHPLRDCHVPLTQSHRFAADSALGALAAAITNGDVEAALAALERAGDVSLIDTAPHAQLANAAATAYRPILDAADPAAALHAAHRFRVLTALRHGPSGCVALDHAIAQRLQRAAGVRGDERWWRGRLLLITANRPELGLFNGDTGVVWPDTDGVQKAWFEGSDGAPRSLPVAALPPHEGAFALTVHKAQGSEFEHVALVTGPDSGVLSRELLYTGVTRARVGVAIYATPDTLRAGIERRTLRFSGLADRLRETAHVRGT